MKAIYYLNFLVVASCSVLRLFYMYYLHICLNYQDRIIKSLYYLLWKNGRYAVTREYVHLFFKIINKVFWVPYEHVWRITAIWEAMTPFIGKSIYTFPSNKYKSFLGSFFSDILSNQWQEFYEYHEQWALMYNSISLV